MTTISNIPAVYETEIERAVRNAARVQRMITITGDRHGWTEEERALAVASSVGVPHALVKGNKMLGVPEYDLWVAVVTVARLAARHGWTGEMRAAAIEAVRAPHLDYDTVKRWSRETGAVGPVVDAVALAMAAVAVR